jgi:hypothetical protein
MYDVELDAVNGGDDGNGNGNDNDSNNRESTEVK